MCIYFMLVDGFLSKLICCAYVYIYVYGLPWYLLQIVRGFPPSCWARVSMCRDPCSSSWTCHRSKRCALRIKITWLLYVYIERSRLTGEWICGLSICVYESVHRYGGKHRDLTVLCVLGSAGKVEVEMFCLLASSSAYGPFEMLKGCHWKKLEGRHKGRKKGEKEEK